LKAVATVREAARRFGRERIGTFRVLVAVRLLQWPLRAIARPIVRRVRRDPKLIAFGAGSGRFADNSAYLFLHMARSPEPRCVWISPSAHTVERLRALGLEAYRRWSVEGIRVGLRASWYVVSSYRADINVWLSDGAVALDLWHGVGVKRIQRGRTSGPGSSVYLKPERSLTARIFADDRRPPDWLLTSSPMVTNVFSGAFDIPIDHCLELGYPRNDHLVSGLPPPAELVDPELYDAIAGSSLVVGYFPTFRDDSLSLPGGAPVVSEMSEIVHAQGGTFLFKAHDATSLAGLEGPATVVLPKEADLNTYLGLCDVLITDYSSVVTDFLLLKRPVVLFCPDLDEYRDGRGFYFDPAEVLPGRLTRTRAELYDAISHLADLTASDDVDRLTELWWTDPSPGASARLARFVLDQTTTGAARPEVRRC
jgi:CDP-glycerol glycerophosphotransferase (TagB/SpsB family)